MKILITGGLGHIGSALIRYLPKKFINCEIVIIDNLSTQRYSSLFDLPNNAKYNFIEGDIREMLLDDLIVEVDVVIHLAAITDAANSFGREGEVEDNNFEGTKRIATLCEKYGAKLISISSTSVYGTQSLVVDESCTPDELRPQSPYAATKLKEEAFVSELSKSKGLQAVICRFGTIFGPSIGMRFHTAVNKFCWQAVMGQPISVWKTALEQKRPYLELNDACKAIGFIIENNIYDGEIYNILSDNYTVREVVSVIEHFVPNIKIEFVDNQIMNQLSYEVSCQKFKKLGFIFNGDIKGGIGEIITLIHNANLKNNSTIN
jgi:UDP-glucose 4-epimerase